MLSSVRCVNSGNCWAVGTQARNGPPSANQILHWTGRKWFKGASSQLNAVRCTSAANCWAVGDYRHHRIG